MIGRAPTAGRPAAEVQVSHRVFAQAGEFERTVAVMEIAGVQASPWMAGQSRNDDPYPLDVMPGLTRHPCLSRDLESKFRAFLETEAPKWARVAKAANVKID